MRWTALLVCLLLAGCERRAPGPAECVAFADRAVDPWTTRELRDDLVRRCLTAPFSRGLLDCVDRTGNLRLCRDRLAAGLLRTR